jgi:GMP synthase (glutamine-hydrolysing)
MDRARPRRHRGGGTSADALRADHAEHGPSAVAAGQAMIAEWLAGLA